MKTTGCNYIFRRCTLGCALAVLISALIMPALAVADSIEDGFASLDKNKGGSTAGQGIDAELKALNKGKGKAGKASGHGVDAGFADLEATRAEKKRQAAVEKRARLEQEAKERDKEMEKECYCVYNSCNSSSGLVLVVDRDSKCRREANSGGNYDPMAYNQCMREVKTREESEKQWRETHRAEIEEENRREAEAQREARRAKKKVCDEWKKAGSTANSESFKARLRKQDSVVAEAQRVAAEHARQLDALIEADSKERMTAADRAEKKRRQAAKSVQDAKQAAVQAKKAEQEAAAAAQEAKTRQWCLAEIAKGHDWCGCAKYATERWGTCMK